MKFSANWTIRVFQMQRITGQEDGLGGIRTLNWY